MTAGARQLAHRFHQRQPFAAFGVDPVAEQCAHPGEMVDRPGQIVAGIDHRRPEMLNGHTRRRRRLRLLVEALREAGVDPDQGIRERPTRLGISLQRGGDCFELRFPTSSTKHLTAPDRAEGTPTHYDTIPTHDAARRKTGYASVHLHGDTAS